MKYCTAQICRTCCLEQVCAREWESVSGERRYGVAREWNGHPQTLLSRAGMARQLLFGEIMFRNWMRLTHDAMLLGLESQRVMGLRLMKLSRGGRAAQAEARRMFSEKTTALAEAGTTLARGGSAGTVIRRYRSRVRSNKRRLSKS
jgi:hypothetical protein